MGIENSELRIKNSFLKPYIQYSRFIYLILYSLFKILHKQGLGDANMYTFHISGRET